jgi:DNA-binding NarL/FixJ family response regulator
VKILIVDDHELVRGGLAQSLRYVSPDAEILQAGSLREALTIMKSGVEIALVLIDLQLPDSQGIDTLTNLRSQCGEKEILPRIVVISGTEDPALVRSVIQEQATGFIPKSVPEKMFAHAVRITLDGGVYIPELMCHMLAQGSEGDRAPATISAPAAGRPVKLSAREEQIAGLLVRGLTYKQIARELTLRDGKDISDLTVRTHVSNIAWKMGVQSGGKLGVMAEISRRGLKYP